MSQNKYETVVDINIKPGYRISFLTWENDADHYKTQIIDGLSEEDVLFYQELASHFNSKHDYENPGYGNDEDVSDETLQELVKEILDNHPMISLDVRTRWENTFDERGDIRDQLQTDILGSPVEYSWKFMRVVEEVKIYFVEKPILIQEKIENVTHKFKIK